MRFASRALALKTSIIRDMFDRGRLNPDIVDLSIGQTEFDVPPAVKQAARDALDGECGRYSPTEGYPEVVDAVRAHLRRTAGLPEHEDVIVTAGATGAINLAILLFAGPGDEVLLPDPGFSLYRALVGIAGATATTYALSTDFQLRADAVAAAMTERTRLVVINNPSNPTGTVFARDQLAAVAALCAERGVPILSDEVYQAYTYEGVHTSIKSFPDVCSLLIGGPGKSHGMAGWRFGWGAGPREAIDRMRTIQQYTYTCPPTLTQLAARAVLDLDPAPIVARHRARRDHVVARLADAGFAFTRPTGAFYIFPRVPWGTDFTFCEAAARAGVLVVPGTAFGSTDRHFRLSYSAPDDRLDRGLDILAGLVRR